MTKIFTALAFFGAVIAATAAGAAQPVDWQMGFQPASSPVMEDINSFHNFLLVIITAITLFVLALLVYCMVRFNAKANPTPSKTTHNTFIEVVWTVVPVLILVAIAIPSFRLLYFEAVVPESEVTIKATGYQWYWGYSYPDHGDFEFFANMIEEEDLDPGQPRLLATDTKMVVPVDTNVRVIVTAADVIHNWAMPAFGVKMDAVPGRLNETWFRATQTGIFYGQCSELCGVRHAFMPIEVHVVAKDDYEAWVTEAQAEYALNGTIPASPLEQQTQLADVRQ
ncbi:cytochrome c oxidase subunit II [Pyruvatibacter sp.]|uniref:cytochrome c oxidase subunit II n=1 Tax=Pyruvatibacter sp. TaxID=1981328 RepID=UPI0032EEAF9B